MMEKTDTKPILKHINKHDFYNETIVEDFDLQPWNFDNDYEVVFENDKYQICKPTKKTGLIPLSAGTTWIASNDWYSRTRDKKSKYDDVDPDSWTMRSWDTRYVILDKNNPKKKWMFTDGLGDIYSPSFARYSCATWVADNGDQAMWKWFLDKKFPYISTNLDKKVGHKLITDKTVFTYPDDIGTLSWRTKSNSNITQIVIREGTTIIKANAFEGLNKVERVDIPNTVTSIGSNAFYYCASLKQVTLPSSLKKIGRNAFYYCTSLTNLEIPDTVKTIGDAAFYDCSSLKTIKLPKNLTELSDGVLCGCPIENLDIPQNITSMGNACLRNTHLKNIVVPNKVETIGGGAFAIPSLETIYIPKSVQKIKAPLFMYWNNNEVSNITINCEAESKPEGWNKDWAAKSGDWSRTNYEYRYTYLSNIHWGVPNPSASTVEEVDLGEDLAGVNDSSFIFEEMKKILESFDDTVVIIDNYLFDYFDADDEFVIYTVNNDNILSLKPASLIYKEIKEAYSNYINENDDYDISLLEFSKQWISKLNEHQIDFENEGHYRGWIKRLISNNYDYFNSSEIEKFKSEFDINEDFDLHPVNFSSPTLYEDEYWAVRKPTNNNDLQDEASSTAWFSNNQDTDWYFDYYESNPFFIFENKKTGERYLYNTRQSWSSIKKDDGNTWQPTNRYRYSRTPSGLLYKFLKEAPNADGLIRWCVKKWPSGLQELKYEVKANDYIAKNGNIITYKSEMYNKIRDTNWYDDSSQAKELRAIRDSFKYVVFPRNTHKIEDNAFREWKGLEYVVIPNTVTEIGYSAFYQCKNLKSLTLSNRIAYIGEDAFGWCPIENEIFIPSTCEKIESSPFVQTKIPVIKCDFPEKPEGWDAHWNFRDYETNLRVEWLKADNSNTETTTNEDLDLKPQDDSGVVLKTVIKLTSGDWSWYDITSEKLKNAIIEDISKTEQFNESQKPQLLDYLNNHLDDNWAVITDENHTSVILFLEGKRDFTINISEALRRYIIDTAEDVSNF